MTVHLPVAGLYSSALVIRLPLVSSPPATRTCPFVRSVVVCPIRGKFSVPVAVQVPEAWAKAATLQVATNQMVNNAIEMKLEVIVIPVSDVDRAKRFYGNLGWRLDLDYSHGDDYRVIQFTPPGSGCSILGESLIKPAAQRFGPPVYRFRC